MAAGATSWWIIWAPDAPAGQPSHSFFQGAQSQAAAEALKIVDGSVAGPYASQAAAQQAVSSGSVKSPPSTAQASNSPSLGNVPGAGAVTNDLSALGDVAAAMKSFYSAVTDGKMWRSVAWILLGLILMVNGILLWLKIPQRAAGIAGAAARVL
jgi:hypothetical protein